MNGLFLEGELNIMIQIWDIEGNHQKYMNRAESRAYKD